MGSGNVPFEWITPLFGAYYAIPFEVKMLILGAVTLMGILWWFRKQGDNR